MPRRLLLALLGGAALCFAFPGYDQWYLAPVGIALLAVATAGASVRQGLLAGLVGGLTFFLVTLHWSGVYVGNLPWIALACSQAVFVAAMGGVCAYLQSPLRRPLPGPMGGPTGSRMRGRLRSLLQQATPTADPSAVPPGGRVRPVVVGLAWVGQEALRDRVPYGGFPWVRLAFSQAGSPLGRLASLGGAPLVTFAVALSGGLLAAAGVAAYRRVRASEPSTRGWLTAAGALVGALVVALGGALVRLPTDGPSASIMAVQGNVPTAGLEFNAQRRAVLDYHVNATLAGEAAVQAGTATKPDLVVWPENSSDIDPLLNDDAAAQITRALRAVQAPIVVGALREEPLPHISNVSILYEPGVGAVDQYVKQHPVPFAEYIPNRSFFRLFSDKVDLVRADFAAGTTPVVFRVPSASGTPILAGPTICFEVAYDDLVRENVDLGANLLMVQTNNATFGYTDESVQQLAISRIRAMEHGRSVVHISTVGVSALITPDGTPHQRSSLFTRAVLSGQLPLRSSRTLATVVGPWPEYAGCALLVLLLGVGLRTGRRRREATADAPRGVTDAGAATR